MKSAVQGALALVLTVALPFAGHAASESEIRNCIISINRLYESLDYEFALNQVQLGHQLPRSTDEEVTLSLYEGIILCEMGKPGPGTSAFRAALLLRPEAKLPVRVAPKVEALFESMRKQVKQEVASLLPPSGTEKTSNKVEQKREAPPAPPSTGPALEKHEDTRIAASTEHPPMPSTTSALKAEQKKEAPVAVQPPKSPDHAHPRREAERLETEAGRALIKKKLGDAANLDTSKCRPVVSTECERELLMQRINTVYKIFLSTNPPSPQSPVKELLTLLNRVQTAHTHEDLQQVSQAIDAWQQRRFPY